MKILLLSQFFSTTKGGGEYVFSLIAKKLAENDHKVWIITNKIIGEEYNSHENIQMIFVPPDLDYKGGLPPTLSENLRYTINAVRKGLILIKKEKINIIHSNNFAPALAGAILSFLTSKPHITAVWDIFTLCGKDYWKRWVEQENVSKIHSIIGPKFEKLILKTPARAIHTISMATKDDLIKFGAKKPIHVISPAIENINCETIQPNSSQFIFVGRLVFYKNVEVLIKAISIARQTKPDIKLIVVGGGPHKEALMNITKNLKLNSNIEFKNYVSADEKIKLIAQSNALLFPSLCEGFGLVILEAFSQSKPVIVSNIRPMSDIVSHGNTGYVLDPHDDRVWAEYLLKLIKNPQESEIMGKNGLTLVKTTYHQELMYQNIIKMYNNVLNLH